MSQWGQKLLEDHFLRVKIPTRTWKSGCSSGVERNLAKVEVVSSNLIARSIAPWWRYRLSGGQVKVR